VNNLRDSKLLKPEVREKLAGRIREKALACGVGVASAYEIDRFNILEATHIAARRAVEQLGVAPDYYLTDNLRPAWARAPVEALVDGDAKVASIAAASILAKTERDRMMIEYDNEYPGYGFAGHKGYCCKPHFAALDRLGPCTLHRLTFQGVAFFTVEPRPSETYCRLKETIAILENAEAARAVRHEIDAIALPLVERERERLGNLLAARLGELGAGAAEMGS
jgi:ribonuclease HII